MRSLISISPMRKADTIKLSTNAAAEAACNTVAPRKKKPPDPVAATVTRPVTRSTPNALAVAMTEMASSAPTRSIPIAAATASTDAELNETFGDPEKLSWPAAALPRTADKKTVSFWLAANASAAAVSVAATMLTCRTGAIVAATPEETADVRVIATCAVRADAAADAAAATI